MISVCNGKTPVKRRDGPPLWRGARSKICKYTIGISLPTNRDFPIAYVNTFLYLCSEKRKRNILLNPLNFKHYD